MTRRQRRIGTAWAITKALSPLLERLVEANIDLRFAYAAEALPVWADRGLLEHLLMNLAVNARDAMPNGGRIEVSAERTNGRVTVRNLFR